MKKFAVLIALLASVGLAQAQVTVFGTMDAGYNDSKAPGSNASTTSFQSGGMTTSNIGIKGGEDLGNGTKAVFELSSFLSNGTGATLGGTTPNTFARSAFVGLENAKLGGLTMGRQSNPSFLPTILFNAYGDSGAYSPLWHATYFGNTGNRATQIYNDTAWDNSIAYTTPSLGGAKATVQTSKTNGAQNTGANVLYFKDNLGLMAYYQRTEANSSGSFQTDIFTGNGNKPAVAQGLGASYDLKVAKVFATWQDTRSDSLNLHGKTLQTSALIPAGPGNVMVEYAKSNFRDGSTKTDVREYAVGYDYPLSKRTDVYATVGRTDVTALTQGQTVGAGLRVRF
jgi:predicted porin